MSRTYPFIAHILTANYNVRKVTLTRPYSESSDAFGAYTAAGKLHRNRDLFETPAKAIHEGRKKLRQWQRGIDNAQKAIKKQTEALDKAAIKAAGRKVS